MPYISESDREDLDNAINQLSTAIKNVTNLDNLNDFSLYLGRINYCFSRVITNVMGKVSYNKIAMVTGVLENVKQEFYRRVASPYEDKKIIQNGDIREYKLLE